MFITISSTPIHVQISQIRMMTSKILLKIRIQFRRITSSINIFHLMSRQHIIGLKNYQNFPLNFFWKFAFKKWFLKIFENFHWNFFEEKKWFFLPLSSLIDSDLIWGPSWSYFECRPLEGLLYWRVLSRMLLSNPECNLQSGDDFLTTHFELLGPLHEAFQQI